MADPNRIERLTLRSPLLSKQFREPTLVGSKQWRRAVVLIHIPNIIRYQLFSKQCHPPGWLTLQFLPQPVVTPAAMLDGPNPPGAPGNDLVSFDPGFTWRTMGNLEEGDGIEPLTFRSPQFSRLRKEPTLAPSMRLFKHILS